MALDSRTAHPTDRRRRYREEMVAAIISASRAVMREHGVAALNLQEVARRVGVRAPSLYQYFEGKDALYDALFRTGVRLWAERVAAIRVRRFDSPWDALRAIFEAYFDFADDHPEMYQLIHQRHVPGFVPSDESLAESVRLTEAGVEMLREWIDRGEIDPALSPEQAFDLVIAVMHGLVGGHLANDPDDRGPNSRFRGLLPAAVEMFRAAWTPAMRKGGPE